MSYRGRGQYVPKIEEDRVMLITVEMTTEKTILEICRIIDVKIIEVDTEGVIEMIVWEMIVLGSRNRSRDRQYPDNIRRNDRNSSRF